MKRERLYERKPADESRRRLLRAHCNGGVGIQLGHDWLKWPIFSINY